MKKKVLLTTIILFLAIIVSIPVSAEDIEETVKYKPPTMDQTVDYLAGIMLDFGDFDSGECLLTTRKVKNNVVFTYHIPLKELDPSPKYIKTRLNCVDVIVPGQKKKIVRIGKNNKEDLRNKIDVCADNRESAEYLTTAMRYLIGICEGDACVDCPPFPWQTR